MAQSRDSASTSQHDEQKLSTSGSGGPECLLVAGGTGAGEIHLNTVEVLTEGEWSTVHPLPEPLKHIPWYFILHNSTLFLGGGTTLMFCQLHSLLASHSQARVDTPWKTMNTPATTALVLFRGHLICFEHNVYAYCPLQQSWVHVQVAERPLLLD